MEGEDSRAMLGLLFRVEGLGSCRRDTKAVLVGRTLSFEVGLGSTRGFGIGVISLGPGTELPCGDEASEDSSEGTS